MPERGVPFRTGGDPSLLRGIAEQRLADAGELPGTAHELRLHQEELDVQGQELRRALAELEILLGRQMERYQAIPAGVVGVRFDGTVAEVNPAACACLGATAEDLLERSLGRFLQEGDRPAFAAFLAGQFQGGASRSLVVRRRALDPDLAGWIHLEGPGALPSEHAFLSVIDVSPLLAREAALRVRRDHAATLLETAFGPLFAVRQALDGAAAVPLEAVQRALTEALGLLSDPG